MNNKIELIRENLNAVRDVKSQKSIQELNLIKNIEINENQVYNNVINNNKILTSGFLCVKIINALFKGEGL